MTREEAEIYAQDMSYEDAIHNLFRAKCVPYKKATFTKIRELLEKINVPEGERGEYIKKEDILKELKQNEIFFLKRYKKFQDINCIERAIADRAVANVYTYLILFTDNLPVYSIPEREEGEREVDEDGNVNCPFCGMSVYDNFCSHCGAKMRG